MDRAFHLHKSFVRPHVGYYVKFPWNAVCKWMAALSKSGRKPVFSPHSAISLCLSDNVSANFKLLLKWLDRCDDSRLSFLLKVTSKFCPSVAYVFISQIKPDTASYTILTGNPYFVLFPGLYIPNFRRPRHGIVASSSDSSLSCKLTWISAENIHTQEVFWIAFPHLGFPGLFYHQS